MKPRILEKTPIKNWRYVFVENYKVQFPNKTVDLPYVKITPSAHIVALNPEGKIAFVKQYRYMFGKDCLEIPAGAIDPGSTPLETAKQELVVL